jgi:hypothetical protein
MQTYIMRIAIIMKLVKCINTGTIRYDTIDTFTEFRCDDEPLETQIMKKYPTFEYVHHCDDNIIRDTITNEKYIIASTIL